MREAKRVLGDKITQELLSRWDQCDVIQDEIEIARTTLEETKRLEKELGEKPKEAQEVTDYLNSRTKRELKDLNISKRTHSIKLENNMTTKHTLLGMTKKKVKA